jgi:hypothetical protein
MDDFTKNNKKMYNLKRSHNEMYINDYNPAILLIWQSNMDIQFINDPSGILNRYILILKNILIFRLKDITHNNFY